ncbi:hypothetical protein HJG60_012070 [Phyllostomus discolor]|uniref:Uncharacterized protein n=1 Tax=Phyllostomus discolor TaxID=89673 RepID=A0A833ZLW7_9CHIR|nr:hypothetical protein HJG60_012070 [Phyllostomus discolor]
MNYLGEIFSFKQLLSCTARIRFRWLAAWPCCAVQRCAGGVQGPGGDSAQETHPVPPAVTLLYGVCTACLTVLPRATLPFPGDPTHHRNRFSATYPGPWNSQLGLIFSRAHGIDVGSERLRPHSYQTRLFGGFVWFGFLHLHLSRWPLSMQSCSLAAGTPDAVRKGVQWPRGSREASQALSPLSCPCDPALWLEAARGLLLVQSVTLPSSLGNSVCRGVRG